MTNPTLTASRIELASKCPGSQAHEHVATTSEAAERGTQIHEYIAALVQDEECPLPPDHQAASICRGLDRQELVEAARLDASGDLYTEIGLYLSPTSITGVPGEAGVLEGDYHRDYSGAPEGSIPGTADVVAVEDVRVVVSDWKTGSGEVPHPADNYQLRFLGLAAARAFERDEAVIQVGRIATDGSVELRSATLEAVDLEATDKELARIIRRVQQARAGEPVYWEGSHCKHCPALPSCPAISGSAQAILEGPPEELTPKKAAELWSQLQAVEAAAKHTRQALQEFVYARPVPTSEGKQLKVVETRRENIDSSKAFAILREHLPDDALSEVISVTKTSLSSGLSKEAQSDAMAKFKEAGAIIETYSESLREVRSSGSSA
jgi:hypothetical protein